jgi:DNA polymerase-1
MDLDLIKKIASYTCVDNRVRDPIDQISTKTGRIYRSLQSVKKDGPIRSFFQAPDGYKFIVADYSQQEARILAALAEDQKALEIFQDGKDLYLEVAKIMKGGTEEDHRKFRKWAKLTFLGQINGMTDWGTYLQLEKAGWQTDIDHVGHLISNLYDEFDGIAKWQSTIVEKAKIDALVVSKLGRRLKVDDDVKDNSIVNFPIQATASDGFKLALLDLDRKLEGRDARIVHIIHDEIIVEAKEDIADEVSKIVKECMEKAYENMLSNCPFLVEPKITDSWG